jgi:ribosome-binding factor A
VPELLFYHDDTSERAEHIEQALKGEDNPIKKPDLLMSRKKS